MRVPNLLTTSALVLALVLLAMPALAADLPIVPADGSPSPDQQTLRAALTERAVLYEIRSAFDVVSAADIPDLLRNDAKRLAGGTALEDERTYVEQDLLAEGYYYIVSLTYLADVGGANWPTDRQAAMYQRDAEVKLDALRRRWADAVQTASEDPARIEDLAQIMTEVDIINAWSEGDPKLTPDRSHFANTLDLVDHAIAGLSGAAGNY